MNSDFKYRVSVIIPIYNSEKYLEKCVESVMKDQGDVSDIEVVLINDGSTDSSPEICEKYAEKYENVLYISKENEGLSATRNCGIKEAHGKYFLYLDSDDTLLAHTIDKVADFFDEHYDEIDLVTYPQIDIRRDGTLHKHFRFAILDHSGVYDLYQYPYITQTRVNVMVKNRGKDNVLFDTTPGFRHEDSAYNSYVLMNKMKIGYCDEGGYIYALNDNNITANYFYAYYIFETSFDYYERLFSNFSYGQVPRYFQSLVLNDISWKLRSSKLFPFHYKEERFKEAFDRIVNLIKQMDDEMILNHPDVDIYHKYYFLSLKGENYHIVQEGDKFYLYNGKTELSGWRTFGLVIQSFKVRGNRLTVKGMLRNPASLFLPMKVWVAENGNEEQKRELETFDTTYNFQRAKIKVANFRRFVYTCDLNKVRRIKFFGEINGRFYETMFKNTINSPFDLVKGKNSIIKDKRRFVLRKHDINIQEMKGLAQAKALAKEELIHYKWDKKCILERRKIKKNKDKSEIWLYNDANTNIENGLLQFRHDMQMDDDVKRYYIYDNELDEIRHHFRDDEMQYLVRFGSDKHKDLFNNASKILTAYAQINYYCPYPAQDRKKYMDLWDYELIYLQHGILHATLPWQYGNDRLNIDKTIVSSNFELENMVKKYAYSRNELIPSGMVRFDYIDRNAQPKNKILIAPSWRHYLIGDIVDNRWTPYYDKFMKSEYYTKYVELFNSSELKNLLDTYNMEIDFKLHPIFEVYMDTFSIDNPRIHLVKESVNLSDYKICVTDFSSFVFDFVYCNKPVLYFMPDYVMIKSGMHTYRELDIPLEDGFGKLAVTPEELIDNIGELLENGCRIAPEYKSKSENFFTCFDHHGDRTYEAIKGK